jgi:hypothetical protein
LRILRTLATNSSFLKTRLTSSLVSRGRSAYFASRRASRNTVVNSPLRKRSRNDISPRIWPGVIPSIEPRSQGWKATPFVAWSSSG